MSTFKMCNTRPVRNCSGRAKPSHFTHSKTRRLGYAITGEAKNGKYILHNTDVPRRYWGFLGD